METMKIEVGLVEVRLFEATLVQLADLLRSMALEHLGRDHDTRCRRWEEARSLANQFELLAYASKVLETPDGKDAPSLAAFQAKAGLRATMDG